MNKYIIILLLITGCAPNTKTEYKVTCDNGFETPWSLYTTNGYRAAVISWRTKTADYSSYVIPSGVICTTTSKQVYR